MTLVIGTVCSDGMFFCADTEEGTADGFKRQVQKLYQNGTKDWGIIVATAGHGALSEMAATRIIGAAFQDPATFVANHYRLMEDIVMELHEKYINPYSRDDDRHRDRQFAPIIGVVDMVARQPYLYQTEEEILSAATHPFACAGVGRVIGNYYLDRLFRDERPPTFSCTVPAIREAERLLQFVMKEAKSSVGSVGGSTTMANMPFKGGYGTATLGPGWEAAQPNLSDVIDYFWLDEPEPKQLPKQLVSGKCEDQR